MGTRTTVLGTTLTSTHQTAAQAGGRNALEQQQTLANQLQDVITTVNEMLKDMESGANKTAWQGFLTTLG